MTIVWTIVSAQGRQRATLFCLRSCINVFNHNIDAATNQKID